LQYRQNANLRRELFATAQSVLVEASKDDCRWGIGSTKDDRMSWRCRTWRGYNWLGNILTETRNRLMKEVCNFSAHVMQLCVVLFYDLKVHFMLVYFLMMQIFVRYFR